MSSRKTSIVFIAFYLAYTSIYIARLNLSVASPQLISGGVLDTVQLGLLGSVFSVVYASGRLINGRLSDGCSPRLMISLGLALSGFSNLALGILPPFIPLALLWGMNALGQSMLWGSMLVIVSKMYDEDTVKQKTAYLVTAVGAGNVLGIIINTAVIKYAGAGAAFVVPGTLNLLICLLIIFSTRNVGRPEIKTAQERGSMLSLLKDRSVQRQLIPAMADGAIKENVTLWMTVYFVDSFLIDLDTSAGFVLFIPLLGMLGRALCSGGIRLCGYDENKLTRLSLLLCALCSLPLCFFPSAIVAALCLGLIYALTSMCNTAIISIFPHRYSKSGNIAAVSGLLDFAAYSGSAVSAAVYGLVIKNFGYQPMYISWLFIALIAIWQLSKLIKEAPAVKP